MLITIIVALFAFLCGVFFGGLLMQLHAVKEKNAALEKECDEIAKSHNELHELLIQQNVLLEQYINVSSRVN